MRHFTLIRLRCNTQPSRTAFSPFKRGTLFKRLTERSTHNHGTSELEVGGITTRVDQVLLVQMKVKALT